MSKKYEYSYGNNISSYARIRRFLLGDGTNFAAKEAYKSTRTHLLYTCPGEGTCKKIAFTSSIEHEGKTLTCINLAISLAESGKKVLIIDADLRRPMHNNVFELHESQGLSEQLAGITNSNTNAGQVFACKTKYDNLAVLPAGHIPPNPTELLSAPQLHNIIEVLEQHFDYIFIDTPPIGVVTDTALLIPEVQGHIFVVRAGTARMDGLRKAVDTMDHLGANILGFILNDYDPKKGLKGYGRHGAYGRYGSYGAYGVQQGRAEEGFTQNELSEVYSRKVSDDLQQGIKSGIKK